jgi:hypothetical protein
MIRLTDLLKEEITNPYSDSVVDIVTSYIDMKDVESLIKAGNDLEKINFPDSIKFQGRLFRVMKIKLNDFKLIKQGKKEIILPVSSWSKTMDGVSNIYNQDYFGINTDTEIGLVFTTVVSNSDVILDIENWIKGLPKNSMFSKTFNKNMIKDIKDEKEVLLKAGQKVSKNNLIGFFDPEGWGFKKITPIN